MEYSIGQVAKAAGTTSRALRHYDSLGLLPPSRVARNGYRYYDDRSLVRLQRVLLLRELGLGLDDIASVLAAQDANAAERSAAETEVLTAHLELLRQEQHRITTQIQSLERTIVALGHTQEKGRGLMEQNVFEGFDHTKHREEVERRWGASTYAKSDAWWRGLGDDGQQTMRQRVESLNADWIAAAESGVDPTSDVAQALAARHVEWLRSVPHTPASEPGGNLTGYVLGLAEMYVADERFAENYGGFDGARFVRDALQHYVSAVLS